MTWMALVSCQNELLKLFKHIVLVISLLQSCDYGQWRNLMDQCESYTFLCCWYLIDRCFSPRVEAVILQYTNIYTYITRLLSLYIYTAVCKNFEPLIYIIIYIYGVHCGKVLILRIKRSWAQKDN